MVVGKVVDPAGAAVAGALVALIAYDQPEAREVVESAADGSFRFDAEPGRYSLTATAPGWVGTYEPLFVGPGVVSLVPTTMTLDPVTDGVAIRGTVLDQDGGPLLGARVRIVGQRGLPGDIFYAGTDQDAAFVVHLPRAAGYRFFLDADHAIPVARFVAGDAAATIELRAVPSAPLAVTDWIREHARPLITSEVGQGFADLEATAMSLGDARVVALGEATHGTREFFQMKHRLFEYLVSKRGFTVFAIEASFPEALRVNEYVVHGEGDAVAALFGMHCWPWVTEEVLALIEWMRAYNTGPSHTQKLRFYGFDMQFSRAAAAVVRTYLKRVDSYRADVDLVLTQLGEKEIALGATPPTRLTAAECDSARAVLAGLYDRFEDRREHWVARSNVIDWTFVRHHVRVLQQWLELHRSTDPTMRDQAMAENVRWILDYEPSDTRMVVWAHNVHIQRVSHKGATQPPPWDTMGTHLARDLGEAYRSIGFVFGDGALQAWSARGAEEHRVGPPPRGTVDAVLAGIKMPFLWLDLRELRRMGATPVGEWFETSPPTREIGAGFLGEAAMLNLHGPALHDRFDAIVYVDKTTRARPIKWPAGA
jgi:erythromycin esterase